MSLSEFKEGAATPFYNNLTIQLIRPEDLRDIITMLNDDRVNQYLFFAPAEDDFFEQFFHPIIDNTQQAIAKRQWPEHPTAVIRDSDGRYMGMAGITKASFLTGNFEIGYQLPFHSWRQGIATHACSVMTQICFEQLNAHKVTADCYAGNTGSWKTLEKCGFNREGRQESFYKTTTGFDDKLIYGMTITQYKHLSKSANLFEI